MFTSVISSFFQHRLGPQVHEGHLAPLVGGGLGRGKGSAVFLQLLEDGPGPLHHPVGDPGQLGHLDAVALIGPAPDDLPQEEDLVPLLLGGDVVVLHPGDLPLQHGELVVVGGKEGLAAQAALVGAVLHHGAGDGHAVVGAGAPADLVQNKQGAAGGVFQ